MSESEESITVKIERTDEDLVEIENQEEIEQERKCDWCGSVFEDFDNFGKFCTESCFNSSRRAQFKKTKFGIEIKKRSFSRANDASSEKIQKR